MVKKVFATLITIVACVVIGAMLLNVILPNATKQIVNATEDMIYKATGIGFDFNNDGDNGSDASQDGTYTGEGDSTDSENKTVEGFN